MPKFPEPPSIPALAALGAAFHHLPAGACIWRVYFQAGAHPTTWDEFRAWGPTEARFDHHLPPPRSQGRMILYGATGPAAAVTAVAEVFQATRLVERARRMPTWVAFQTTEELRLLDLTGTWPTRAGASLALSTGQRARARRWSRMIYGAFPQVDGLIYGSSMNASQPCIALYEPARRAVPAHPVFHRLLSDPVVLTMLRNACRELNYALS